jgi:hypothetical protein
MLNSTEKTRIRHQSTKTPNLTKGFGAIGVLALWWLKNLKTTYL